MSERIPFDQWIAERENVRASSSRLGRSLFDLPKETRAATEEEQRDAHFAMVQEHSRDRGRKKKNWRRRRRA